MQKDSDQLQILKQKDCQEATSSLSDSLAKICQSLEGEKDSKESEAVYSTKQLASLGLQDPNILSLKMSKGLSQVTKEKTLRSYCKRLPTLGMMVNGNYLIHGGFSPKIESEYTLLDILEEEADQKYFLSEKAVNQLQASNEQ